MNQIRLYYISTSNQLSISVSDTEIWISSDELSSYTTSQNTRQLSLTSKIDTNDTFDLPINKTINQGLLLYENPLGNVTALLKIRQPCTSDPRFCGPEVGGLNWLDISKNNKSVPQSGFLGFSSTLYESSPESIFSTPFASALSDPVNGSDLNIQLLICASNLQPMEKVEISRCNSMASVGYTSWTNTSHGEFFTGMYSKSSKSITEIVTKPTRYQDLPNF